MIAYKIPPTPEGIYCALYESFTLNEIPVTVFSSAFQPSFDCIVKTIAVVTDNAGRVRKGLIKCGGISLLSALIYALRSSDELAETVVFNAARKCLDKRKNLLDDFSDTDMLSFYELKSKISYEAHRMLGFVRFEKSVGGIWYAHISPDNNITDLIAPHFAKRFSSEKFVIHDTKRNILSIYNGKKTITLKSDKPVTVCLDRDEITFQSLWRSYFDAVNIEERKNPIGQANFLPHRYRRNMTEFLNNFESEITSSAFPCDYTESWTEGALKTADDDKND